MFPIAGKSSFILKLVEHRELLFDKVFQRIIYCLPRNSGHQHYAFSDKLRKACHFIEIVEGLPTQLSLTHDTEAKLIIMDDLIMEVVNSPSICNMFVRDSHHANLSIIYTSQNIYVSSRHGVTISRNCSELVIFNAKGDQQVLSNLGNREIKF